MRIYLDMDGVVANLHLSICRHLKLDHDTVAKNWPRGVHKMADALQMDDKELWDGIKALGAGFWADVPEFPWSRFLYDECSAIATTRFLTSPINGACCDGKWQWITRFVDNPDYRDYIISSMKSDCARWDRILIDDTEANCEAFENEGGKAILFPRVWNRLHTISANPMEHVIPELRRLSAIIKGIK